MTRTLRLVTIGFETAEALSLRKAIAQINAGASLDVDWRPFRRQRLRDEEGRAAIAAALDDADVLLTQGVVDDDDADVVTAMVAARPRLSAIVVPPGALSLVMATRLGSFDAAAPSARSTFAVVAGAAARAGVALPPSPPVLMQALAKIAHLLPDEAGPLRLIGKVLQGFANGTPANVQIAVETLAATLWPDELSQTAWPTRFPDAGFWHPDLGVFETWEEFAPKLAERQRDPDGCVMLVCFRSHVVSGNDRHLREIISALEAERLAVTPWFGSLDSGVASDSALRVPNVDCWVNLTGFTLTGNHGAPRVDFDVELLSRLDTPHLAPVPLLFQSVQEWQSSRMGFIPAQVAMQVAIPEIEGGASPLVVAGRDALNDEMRGYSSHVARLARLVRRTVDLRRLPNHDKRVAIVIFQFHAGDGSVGTAAALDVFASLHALMRRLRAEGYVVNDLPDTPEALKEALTADDGDVPIVARYPAARYARVYPETERVAKLWGRPPGEIDADDRSLFIRGRRFGNVFIGLQPTFGLEGDPLKALYAPESSPPHSFAAFYTWLHDEFRPHALIHFGTHGALEFMPGKQVGLGEHDYPETLIGDVPHFYLYCINNPSEASIAKRRSRATIISYLSPPIAEADLYGALLQLRDDVEACLAESDPERRAALLERVVLVAEEQGFSHDVDPTLATRDPDAYLRRLSAMLDDVAETLIPLGLHIADQGVQPEEARRILRAALDYDQPEKELASLSAAFNGGAPLAALPKDDPTRVCAEAWLGAFVQSVLDGVSPPSPPLPVDQVDRWWTAIAELRDRLATNDELSAIVRALAGGFIRPGPGGDPVREPDTLPTGRNLHAHSPYKTPTPLAVRRGRDLIDQLLARAMESGGLPESVALVLWGIDNIKTGGEGIAQAFALLGVEPASDALGRVTRFRIRPLEELRRPRIDVVITCSGVFRDLFPLSVDLLDTAIRAVAELDEPTEWNFVRAHAQQQAAALGVSVRDAATRIFSNASGNYGAGVNAVVDASTWATADDLGELFIRRKAFAYGRDLDGVPHDQLFRLALSTVTMTFQNIDSTEVSLADVDHYFEYLGGVSAAVNALTASRPRVMVADTFRATPTIRTIYEAMRLESRARLLNPRWYEAMLRHGYQGVSEIATRLDNTFGWSATVDAIDDWVFSAAAATFVFDDAMHERLTAMNPRAVMRLTDRLVEAERRGLWAASPDEIARLEAIAERLDDLVEGVVTVS